MNLKQFNRLKNRLLGHFNMGA